MCLVLDEEVFSAREVVDLVERYVPLRIDLGSIPREEAYALMERGYPFLEVWSPEREPLHSLSREPDAAFFVESMHAGLESVQATENAPTWENVRELARTFERARREEQAGHMAAAVKAFQDLADRDAGNFAGLGADGLRRIAFDVRDGFLDAREAARSDPELAAALLRGLLKRYAGTRYEQDLEVTLERLETDGAFPSIAQPDLSAADEVS
jgi:hypothetical protein